MKKINFQCPSTPIYNAAAEVVRKIRQYGADAFFVGGCVRNMLMHKHCKDIDIVCSLPFDKIPEIFPDTVLAGAAFGVNIIKHNGFSFEVASAREERQYMDGRHPESVRFTNNFKIDSERRDFTVNAMLYDPESQEIIDWHDGTDDIARGILRTVGDSKKRFNEDYLRMLRAVRFAARYDFVIAGETWQAIKCNAHLCREIAAERVLQELDLMFSHNSCAVAVDLLDRSGILKYILPEVAELHGVEQPPEWHPEGDVFTHTMNMLKRIVYPQADLVWSVLLHDIGKKPCFTRNDRGIHFYGHEAKGALMADELLSRLRMPNNRRSLISTLVRDHMRFVQVKNMKTATLRKFLGRTDLPLLMEINRLDSLCSCGNMNDWLFMLDTISRYRGEDILPAPLISGKTLLKLGYTPGPQFSKILDFIYEKQLSDKKIDFEHACDLIKKHFPCIL